MSDEYILPQVASEVAKALNRALTSVQTVNGTPPDANGNVKTETNGNNTQGADGGYYTPEVTQPTDTTMKVAFTPSKEDMPSVQPVTITLPTGSGNNSGTNVELDTTLTVEGKAADAKAVGNKFAEITGIPLIEPAWDDIPKVFFGAPLQKTKDDAVCQFWYYSKTLKFTCWIKYKAQGNSTLNWPKKNQTIKLYKDEACTEKFKIDFKGWGKQYKFVIKAYWRDLTHARDVGSVRLETQCAKSRTNYAEMPELLRTSPNMGGIDGFPVLVYAGGIYQGRYMWNIPKDAWMANMDDELDTHCILCSEDYNSGCFRAAANINGNDWTDEIHDTVPASIKIRWNEVISFVQNATDEEFVANLDSYIDMESLIDRHLVGLYSCDFDGYGKNQVYMTYDGQKWYAVPYDKDGTWGVYWTGTSMLPSNYGRDQYEDMIDGRPGNLLFIRMEQLLWQGLQERWAVLRDTVLSVANTVATMRELSDITPPYIVAEDYAATTANGAFTDIPNKTTCTIQQIQQFVVERHAWMDEYIASLTPEEAVPCTGITLSASDLTFTESGTQTLTATVEPENTTDTVAWSSDNTSVATVSGGVVTAKGNGACAITATCGEQSATCSVAVSGIAEPVACTGISLDKTELTFTAEGTQTLTATVTPDGCTDAITWESNNTSVATVSGGVVTAVGNGEATITAYCGDYSAICSVSVSGIVIDETLIYKLPSSTTFDGATTFVDTGIQLFDTDKDFTLFLRFAGSDTNNTNTTATVCHCMNEVSPYPGLSVAISGGYCLNYYTGKHNDFWPYNDTEMHTMVLRKTADNNKAIAYLDGISIALDGGNFTAVTQNLLLGCYQTLNGAKGRFWSGTIYECKVWGRALSDTELTNLSGVTFSETYLRQDYSPSGESFIDEVNVDFANGDYVVAEIDLTTCNATNECLLSVGVDIANWSGGNVHTYRKSENTVEFHYVSASGLDNKVTKTFNDSVLTLTVRNNALLCNGEVIVIIDTTLASARTVQVGSAEGNTRSNATYNYIKVCRRN